MPLKGSKPPHCDEQATAGMGCLCTGPPRRRASGSVALGRSLVRGDSGSVALGRSLVRGDVIVYQFPTTHEASHCDRSASHETRAVIPRSWDGKTLEQAAPENSSRRSRRRGGGFGRPPLCT